MDKRFLIKASHLVGGYFVIVDTKGEYTFPKDEDSELGYYKSRCKKGHYECARVSLVHCEDFEIKNGD